eukprot:COSAG01_NODE_49612_length_370_cov_8.339483_1_plen_50_part_01
MAQLTVHTAGCNGCMNPFKAHIDHKLSYPTYIIGSDRQCTPLMPVWQPLR